MSASVCREKLNQASKTQVVKMNGTNKASSPNQGVRKSGAGNIILRQSDSRNSRKTSPMPQAVISQKANGRERYSDKKVSFNKLENKLDS